MRINLKDKSYTDSQTISFIMQCLGQLGLTWVDDAVKKRGIFQQSEVARRQVYSSDQLDTIALATLHRDELILICSAVIDAMVDYEELETIMGITKQDVERQLAGL